MGRGTPAEDFHQTELLICNGHYPDMAFWREDGFDSFYMNVSVFATGAMPDIHAELKHGKSVRHDFLPEKGIVFPVFFGFGWEVEKYQYPHNTIGVES